MHFRLPTVSFALGLCFMVAGASQALAHPHVWVAARATVLFDTQGRITGIRHDWTFDEMYSAFAVTGLGKDGKPPTREELAPLAKTNIDSLTEFDYFTFAREGGHKLAFGKPVDYYLTADDKKIVSLHFTLPLERPVGAKKPFSFQVYDPTYFVAFGFEKKDPIAMKDAPAGCSQSVMDPAPLDQTATKELAAAANENYSPGADLASRVASRVVVACP